MNISIKSFKILIKSQILSIILSIISRIYLDLFIVYIKIISNSIMLLLCGIVFFIMICMLLSILFLNQQFINMLLVFIPYILYCSLLRFKTNLFYTNINSNDYGIGILGLYLELFLGGFQHIIVLMSCIISISIHISINRSKNKKPNYINQ